MKTIPRKRPSKIESGGQKDLSSLLKKIPAFRDNQLGWTHSARIPRKGKADKVEAPGSTYSARIPIKGKADKVEAPAGAGEKTPPWDITKLGGLLGELFAASAVGAAKQSGEHGEEQRRPSFNLDLFKKPDGVVNNRSKGTEQSESNANTPAGWVQRKQRRSADSWKVTV